MNEHIIHTKLYSKIALEVLQSVEENLSDGMWENSPAMEKYWHFSNIETAPDGEVLIEINTESYKPAPYTKCGLLSNGFINMDDTEVIKWFATKVKHIMQTEIVDDGHVLKKAGWSRYNDKFKTKYLSYKEDITVRDVYFIYDFLMGRDVTKIYEGDMSLKIVRAPLCYEETKAEEVRRANIAKLKDEWTAEQKALEFGHSLRIKEIEAEFNKALELCNAKYKKRLDEFA